MTTNILVCGNINLTAFGSVLLCGIRRLLILLSCVLIVKSAFPQHNSVQISLYDSSILELFNQIENQSSFNFFYKSTTISEQIKFNYQCKKCQVTDILDSLLHPLGLNYEFVNNNIVITPVVAHGSKKSVSGSIKDDKTNEVLTGVIITEIGTRNGIISDESGNYKIETETENPKLHFQLLGYEQQECDVSNQNLINILLHPKVVKLDEAIVIGYGTIKKNDLTGSVSSVNNDDLNIYGVESPEQMLQGKLSGVQIISKNGEPGAGVNIMIRGISTITTNMQPLYVVDGVPLDGRSSSPEGIMGAPATSPLNFLNPNDIASIDVLKDASAAAIYGSRGAGGVILITTLKGKEGGNTVSYSNTFSISHLPRKLDVLTAYEWREIRNNSVTGLGINPDLSDYGSQTNWQDEIFRTALSHVHNLAFAGGSNYSTFRVSLNYTNQNGIIKQSDMTKYVGRVNFIQKTLNEKLNFETNFTLSSVAENRVPIGAISSEGDLLMNAITSNPTIPTLDLLGYPIQTIASERFPTTLLAYYKDLTRTSNLMGSLAANLCLITNLNFKTSLALSYSNARRLINQNETLIYLTSNSGNGQINERELFNYITESTLDYQLNFKASMLNIMAGYSFQDFSTFSTNMYGGSFASDGFLYTDNLGTANSQQVKSFSDNYKMQSFFGRINYYYDNKYLFTATFRQDGSTKFGKDNRYGSFPSFSTAWRISEEDFMKEFGFISNLKLRLGWGKTGNSDIGSKNTQATYKLAPENVALIGNRVIQGISLVRTSNSRLQWESNESFNTGIDFTLYKGRLSGNVDFYRKKSSHLLLEIPSPPGSPTGTVIINLDSTKIYNRGFEIGLNAIVIKQKDFEWRTSGNFATLINMVKGLPTTYQTGTTEGAGVQGTYIQVITDNSSIGEFVGRKVDFIDKDGVIQYVKKKNKPTQDSTNVELGNSLPKFTFGFNNSLKYKNLSLDLFFEGVYGNKIYNHTAMLADKTFVKNARNALRYFIEDPTSFTKNKSIHVSDRYIEDGSYIRLSTATLNYNFNLKNLLLKSINVFIAGSNLFLLTNYKGYDPDVNSDLSNGSVKSYGIDLTNYPKARTYSFGLNVTF